MMQGTNGKNTTVLPHTQAMEEEDSGIDKGF